MVNIIVFTQNVVLKSFEKLPGFINTDLETVFISTQMLFNYERGYLETLFEKCTFYKFADFLTDEENENCDFEAYEPTMSVGEYYSRIKILKNKLILQKLLSQYTDFKGYLCSDDLGIEEFVWIENGFERVQMEYYYTHPIKSNDLKSYIKTILKRIGFVRSSYKKIKQKKDLENITDEVYVAYKDEKKYVFIGKMSRVAYRMDLEWKKSQEEKIALQNGQFESASKCQYLSSLHECSKCIVPDNKEYDVRYIQDGYLPPNYSSRYLKYKPNNVSYYAWDEMGLRTFRYHNVPSTIMPFRKKLYLPLPKFKKTVKTILVATSGPGDWTAQKNRSDEDLMLQAFVEVAKQLPEIEIIYRCHPTWTHPAHAGVNSINRAGEYIDSTGLKNIHISSNIPKENLDSFILSFSRSSLEDDLRNADIVFGEHSVSMIDGAFQKIPFASVNLTGRRNFFSGITEMGFPHCTNVEDIVQVILNYSSDVYQKRYYKAIELYNKMTDLEGV